MSDPRSTPDPSRVVCDFPGTIVSPIVDLCREPDGPRDRQLLGGADIRVLDDRNDWYLIRAEFDGYCGYVPKDCVGAAQRSTHRVTVRGSHAYCEPDIKSREVELLSFGVRLNAVSETATFIETQFGFVPRQHVHRVDARASDPAAVAEIFAGTPYLWGGNSGTGIDCSGLIQAACRACDISCPGDSDQQQDKLGDVLPVDTPLRRNDLLFWKGHVALVISPDTLIHANAGHMAVAYENIRDAIRRIARQGGGDVTATKRLPVAGV